MSVLADALAHPANRPRALVDWLAAQVNPGADLTGLQEAGGVCCDFRPGLEEQDPSLSVSVGQGGAAVFKRFGGDGFEGGALDFVVSCLNVSKGEAARLLIDRAGLVDTSPKTGEGKTSTPWKPAGKKVAGLEKAHASLAKLAPLPEDKSRAALRGWVRIEAGEDSPEALELAQRGLTLALASGLLTAYRWTGEVGNAHGPRKRITLPAHILPGAVAFEVTGPDGVAWSIKVRNPGSKEDLKAVGANRYAYAVKGHGTPAWVHRLPGQVADGLRFLIVEGELNGAACVVALDAARQGAGHLPPDSRAQGWEVQGVASAMALPHVAHIPTRAQVYLYADPDEEGEKARVKWGEVLTAQGAQVFQLKTRPGGVGVFSSPSALDLELGVSITSEDACDYLGRLSDAPERAGASLLDSIERAKPWQPSHPAQEGAADAPAQEGQDEAGDVWETKRRGYGIRDGRLCALSIKKGEDGEDFESVEVLADFTAFIEAEVLEEEGSGEARRVFHIRGARPDGSSLLPPVVTVPTAEFSGMAWPVAKWGGAARVPAGQGKKDKARDALQVLSNARGYPHRTVFQHTGWIEHPEHGPVYLTAGAVIGAGGAVDGVSGDLGGRLSAYALPDPAKREDGTVRSLEELRAAVLTSLALLDLAPDTVAVPLLGAAYRAPLGPADFVAWPVGDTGRHKTAFMGLVQAHYGARWGRKFLPDGWNSSANALESNAFRVKDALFTIDDFKPSGSAGDRARLDGAASRIIQGAADGAGRGTLTADRRTRAALYPRGLIVTSAEDLPRGHSNRARLVVVPILSPLIHSPALSAAFHDGEAKAGGGVYALALAAYIQGLAGQFGTVRVGGTAHTARVRELAPIFREAHGRTGDAAAELAYGWEVFLSFAVNLGALEEVDALAYWVRVTAALRDTAQGQGAHLVEADPVARALGVLGDLLSQGRVYLDDLRDGGAPTSPDAPAVCGWQRHSYKGPDGEEDTWRTRQGAALIGYHAEETGQDWAYFLPDALLEALQRAVTGQGGAALPDAAKLYGSMRDRLRPAGLMRGEEEAGGRVRYTVKRTGPDKSRRHYVGLRLPIEGALEMLGTVGTLGTYSEERTFQTAFKPVPITLSLSQKTGTLGTGEDVSTFSLLPDALPADLENAQAWAVEI